MPGDEAIPYPGGDLHEPRDRVIEELLIAFAEVVLSILDSRFYRWHGHPGRVSTGWKPVPRRVFGIEPHAILHTAAPADIKMPANETLGAEFLLIPRKRPFLFIAGELLKGRLKNVAQSPRRLDEEFAAEGVAGMFDDDKASALLAVRANGVIAHYVMGQQRVEVANVELRRAVLIPQVEQPA